LKGVSLTMLVFCSDAHRAHNPVQPHLFGGEHLPPKEVPERVERILNALKEMDSTQVRGPEALDSEILSSVHSLDYLGFLEHAHARWCDQTGGDISDEAMPFVRPAVGQPFGHPTSVLAQLGRYSNDSDPILSGTWRAALEAAACAASAARSVLEGESHMAYALTRPPGHHAGPDFFGGYCYLNNTAIAAELSVRQGARVATLDVDTHAGNGTQAIFWSRKDVMCVSIHGDPNTEYPFFQGYSNEIGGGEGLGYNHNLPLPTGSDWDSYSRRLEEACQLVTNFGPDLIVVALGVDTAIEDGVLGLKGDDFRLLGTRLAKLGKPTVLVQEGGYDLTVLGKNVAATIEGFEQSA